MNINKILDDMNVGVGETKRMDCPNCKGRNTFTATNSMGSLIWNCYKASCDLSGGRRVHLSTSDIRKTLGSVAEETHSVSFDKPEFLVRNNKKIQKFCNEWGLNPDTLGLLYDVAQDRVVFPIIHGGVMVDATGRAMSNRLPKWKRYGKSRLPYVSGRGTTVVVVEDCVSAAIVGATECGSGCSDGGGFVGLAVLGTSLSEDHKKCISQFSTAIIALDPDALPKTLQFAKELRGYVSKVKVLSLKDDLKYRNPTDVNNLRSLTYGTITNT